MTAPPSTPRSNPPAPPWGLLGVLGPSLAAYGAACAPLFLHRSQQPVIFGMYSPLYLFVILATLAGLAALAALTRSIFTRREAWDGARRSLALWGGAAAWTAALYLTAWIYWSSGDGDFRHLTYLVMSAGPLAGWTLIAMEGKKRRLLDRMALMALALALGWAALEIAMHLLPFPIQPVRQFRAEQLKYLAFQDDSRLLNDQYQDTLTIDDELGWRQLPNLDRRAEGEHGQVEGWRVCTDAWGFNNQNFDPDGQYDVAVAGDSFVAEAWPQLMIDRHGVSAATFGVPGYSPGQYAIVIRRYALKLHPRAVLFCIYQNDAIDCAVFEEWKASGLDWFTFKGGLWFGAPDPHPGRLLAKRLALRASMIYAMADFLKFQVSQRAAGLMAQPVEYRKEGLDLTFDRAVYRDLANVGDPRVARGIELTGAALARAKTDCDAAGAELIALIFPSKEYVYEARLREAAPAEDADAIGHLAAFHRAIATQCEAVGVPYYDLTETLREASAEHGEQLYRPIDIHWNEAGSETTAAWASAMLVERFPEWANMAADRHTETQP